MKQGTGVTANKFSKQIGNQVYVLTVGNGAGMATLDQLKSGEYTGEWTAEEIAEIIAYFEPKKEKADASQSNAKRGPGRPRKTSGDAGSAGEVLPDGLE